MKKKAQRRARAARNDALRCQKVGANSNVPSSPGSQFPVPGSPSSPERAPATPGPHETRQPPASSPPLGARRIETDEDARALAETLSQGAMSWPIVVITTATGRSEPYVPAATVAEELAGIAEVVLLPTGHASWAFSRGLPAMTQVYGGASRVYSPDRRWLDDPYRSPLRFAHHTGDGARAADQLIADAFGMATITHTAPPATVSAAGSVLGTTASRAIVALDGGGMAAIWAELTVPGVPIERLVAKGQNVVGDLDERSMRLDIRAMVPASVDLAEPAGSAPVHVLARVEAVTSDEVTVALRPGQQHTVPAARAGGDPATAFASGETVVATWWESDGEPHLRLDLWDGEEDVEQAPSILPGGPPWLEPNPEASGQDEALSSDHEDAAESGHGTLDLNNPLGAEVLALRRDVAARREENDRLHRQLSQLRKRVRTSTGRRQSTSIDPQSLANAFEDAQEQFRFDVEVAWAARIPAADKAERPLREYLLGPDFLDTLESLEGVSRAKVIAVVVDVLTGLVHTLDSRKLHQLRSALSGGAPPVVREDGATCWRAAIQRETPSARRLHYWERVDGRVEFSRVVKHDDYTP